MDATPIKEALQPIISLPRYLARSKKKCGHNKANLRI
jgi:hypothetical protein